MSEPTCLMPEKLKSPSCTHSSKPLPYGSRLGRSGVVCAECVKHALRKHPGSRRLDDAVKLVAAAAAKPRPAAVARPAAAKPAAKK